MNKIIIAIIACHTNSHLKYHSIINNINKIYNKIKYFNIIDSNDALFSSNLKKYYENDSKLGVHELIDNNNFLDFGKWSYIIKNFIIKYNLNYDYILLLNDSILITHNIDDFFNENINNNYDLYAYNDSSQLDIYHYQSFLFFISKNIEKDFISFIESKKDINSYQDIINNIELNLNKITENNNCFIKLAYYDNNYCKNLIWHNESLYNKLLIENKYNIIKIKRIIDYYNNFEYNYDLFNNFDLDYYKNNYDDLKNTKDLIDHFKLIGFKEGRRCNKKVISFLPDYYRSILKKNNLSNIFDIPDDFDIYYYKKYNESIIDLDNKECMKHYLDFGVHMKLKYK